VVPPVVVLVPVVPGVVCVLVLVVVLVKTVEVLTDGPKTVPVAPTTLTCLTPRRKRIACVVVSIIVIVIVMVSIVGVIVPVLVTVSVLGAGGQLWLGTTHRASSRECLRTWAQGSR